MEGTSGQVYMALKRPEYFPLTRISSKMKTSQHRWSKSANTKSIGLILQVHLSIQRLPSKLITRLIQRARPLIPRLHMPEVGYVNTHLHAPANVHVQVLQVRA